MIQIPSSSYLLAWPMATTQSRRDLILAAMIRVVGAKGYRDTSVADVIEEAGTSRTTFYKHFEDKHDCFLAAYDDLVERVFGAVVANCDGEQPWLDRMRVGLAAVVGLFAVGPALARAGMGGVGVAEAGAAARQRHWNAVARFTEYLEAGRELADGRELPENIALMSAGAVSGLIFDEVLAGRARHP